MRDTKLELLEAEALGLARKLSNKRTEMLLEEIQCFKDVLALHKRQLEEHDQPRS